MPSVENKPFKIDDLPDFVTKLGKLLFLREDVDTTVFDHHSIDSLFIEWFINDFQFGDVILITFPVEGSSGVDKYSHGAAGELVVVSLAFFCRSSEGIEGRRIFE